MADRHAIASRVKQLVREGFNHEFGKPRIAGKADTEWRKIRDAGTTLWLDTGDMEEAARLWNSEFEALTTNNTLLNKEVQKGIYDELVGKAAATIREAARDIDQRELILEVAFVLNAYHGLRLVEQFDAHVSVELHTDLAHDLDRTVAYGKRYYDICPERFYVKVPMTPAGYLATRKLSQSGVPINFTLRLLRAAELPGRTPVSTGLRECVHGPAERLRVRSRARGRRGTWGRKRRSPRSASLSPAARRAEAAHA